ncbi:MAG: DUF4281 domain-containing protein [Caldilineaceae bacterium]|nr:DUF4281 domain-containing protein [Caldilineaceae bacterium]
MASLWPMVPAAVSAPCWWFPNWLPALLPDAAGQSEPAAIAALLGTPEGATVAWAHFLAFDLFVGRWVYLDGRCVGLSAWVVSPILFFVLMIRPGGLAALRTGACLRHARGRSYPTIRPDCSDVANAP